VPTELLRALNLLRRLWRWQRVHAMFHLTKAAVPHMKPGGAIINTASINSDMPHPTDMPTPEVFWVRSR